MIQKNDLLTLTVIDLTAEGFGVARYSDGDLQDFVIFIKHAALGDVAQCRILKVLKRFAYAAIVSLLTPSPDRMPSDCTVSAQCGGCTFRHVTYDAELRYKKRLTEQVFLQHGAYMIDDVQPSPQEKAYRNKVQYPIRADGKFGFYAVNSHRVIPCETCAIQPPLFSEIKNAVELWVRDTGISCYSEETGKGLLRHLYLRRAKETGHIMVCFVINGNKLPHTDSLIDILTRFPEVRSIYLNHNTKQTNVILGTKCTHIWGDRVLSDTLCGLKTEISPLSFYQVNTLQAEAIYTEALRRCNLKPDDVFLDLYCGVGLIGLLAAKQVKRTVGIEIIPEAIEDAKQNAIRNKIPNADFYAADAANTWEILQKACPDRLPNIVAVDPPRKGLSEETVAMLRRLAPEKIVYISCNPATQARDLQRLPEYKAGNITPFDMFPRTAHVESVVLLSREKADDYIRISVHTKNLQTKAN